MPKPIFVFGSNEGGVHGAGAALTAYKEHGARYGMSYGHYGQSFAIPTKDSEMNTMSLGRIQNYVNGFLEYARGHRKMEFKVTRIGCGLAGLDDADIAPMFIGGQHNVFYDTAWKDYLTDDSKFWGTF